MFTLPLDDDESEVGYGQVVANLEKQGSSLAVVCFDAVADADSMPDVHAVVELPIIIFAFTLDALFFHGVWRVVGHAATVYDRVTPPLLKVLEHGAWVLSTPDCSQSWEIDRDIDRYDSRWTTAPIAVQRALRAHMSRAEWQTHYDKLRPEYSAARSLPPEGARPR